MVRLANVENATPIVGVEAVDGVDDGQERDLAQVVVGHPAAGVALDEVVGRAAVLLDELVAQAAVAGAPVLDELLEGRMAATSGDQTVRSDRRLTRRNRRPSSSPSRLKSSAVIDSSSRATGCSSGAGPGCAQRPSISRRAVADAVGELELDAGVGVLDQRRAHLVDRDPQVLDVLQAEAEVAGDAGRGEPGDAQEAELGRDRQADDRARASSRASRRAAVMPARRDRRGR